MERDVALQGLQAKYAQLCQELGHTQVKVKALEAHAASLLVQIKKLDEQAALLKRATVETPT